MKRRDYLTAVTAGTVVGTAGCFWDDGDSKARLALISVSNYYERPQRFVVHAEENGDDVLTKEIELEGGGNSPTPRNLDCEWSTDAGEFTVEIFQLTNPTDAVEVSVPGELTKQKEVGDCVGVEFHAGSSNRDLIHPNVYACESYLERVELCVDDQ